MYIWSKIVVCISTVVDTNYIHVDRVYNIHVPHTPPVVHVPTHMMGALTLPPFISANMCFARPWQLF